MHVREEMPDFFKAAFVEIIIQDIPKFPNTFKNFILRVY